MYLAYCVEHYRIPFCSCLFNWSANTFMCPRMCLGTIVTLCSSDQCCNFSVRLHIPLDFIPPRFFFFFFFFWYIYATVLSDIIVTVLLHICHQNYFIPTHTAWSSRRFICCCCWTWFHIRDASDHSCVPLTLWMMRPKTGGDLSVVVLVVHLALSCLPNIVGRILYIGSRFGLQRDFSCHCNGLILAYPLGRMLLHIGAPLLVATHRL